MAASSGEKTEILAILSAENTTLDHQGNQLPTTQVELSMTEIAERHRMQSQTSIYKNHVAEKLDLVITYNRTGNPSYYLE